MKNSLEQALMLYSRPFLTDDELSVLVSGTSNSRHSKVKRLLAQGKLLRIRRGLYCLTEKTGCFLKPHPFELAQHIYGPSYVSLESALSFHGLIPEGVYAVTSVTGKRTNKFKTPIGLFTYTHLPLDNFYLGVQLINKDGHRYMMATPWKAICDYVFCYKKNWDSLDPLFKNLRIDLDMLPRLSDEEIASYVDYYHHKRITRFLMGVKKELIKELTHEY